MGKKGDLWDDSALIGAFDSAMCKYKKMHKIECDASTGDVKDADRTEENASFLAVVDETESDNCIRESRNNNKAASSAETEMAETHSLSPDKENHSEDLQGLEMYVDTSNGVADVPKDDSYLLGAGDYNELLKQYYEIEEKRQSVMQQLNQFGTWNYQCSGEGSASAAQWGAYSASQDYTVPVCQASHPTTVCSCCPYVSQCMACPCTSLMARTSGCQLCTDNSVAKGTGKSVAEDGDMVKIAMDAAEQVISSMRLKSEVDSHVNGVKENGEELAPSTSPQTDLNDVLKAWYSAGFYTGKYLVEQSTAKKSHG